MLFYFVHLELLEGYTAEFFGLALFVGHGLLRGFFELVKVFVVLVKGIHHSLIQLVVTQSASLRRNPLNVMQFKRRYYLTEHLKLIVSLLHTLYDIRGI
jgi:hypothetical protein